jgi:hypothetical protein
MRSPRTLLPAVTAIAVVSTLSACSSSPGPDELREQGYSAVGELGGSTMWLRGDATRVNMQLTGAASGYCDVTTLDVRVGAPLCSTTTEDGDRLLVFVAPVEATEAVMTDASRGTRVPAQITPTGIPGVPAVAAAVTPVQGFRGADRIDYTTASGARLDRYGEPVPSG